MSRLSLLSTARNSEVTPQGSSSGFFYRVHHVDIAHCELIHDFKSRTDLSFKLPKIMVHTAMLAFHRCGNLGGRHTPVAGLGKIQRVPKHTIAHKELVRNLRGELNQPSPPPPPVQHPAFLALKPSSSDLAASNV